MARVTSSRPSKRKLTSRDLGLLLGASVPGARVYFASENGLTKLVADSGPYWMDPTLNELEQRLDPGRFFRISRGALINLNAVAEVFPLPGGSGGSRPPEI